MILIAIGTAPLSRPNQRPEDMLTTRLLFCYDKGVFIDRYALTEPEFKTLGKILERYRPLLIVPEGFPSGRIEFGDFADIIEEVEGVVDPHALHAAETLRAIQRRVDADPKRHPSGIALGDQVSFVPHGTNRNLYPDLQGMVVQVAPILGDNNEIKSVAYHLISDRHLTPDGQPVHWQVDERAGLIQVSNYAQKLKDHAVAHNETTSLKNWNWGDELDEIGPGKSDPEMK